MSNVTDLLSSYGVTFTQGRDFIYANLASPKIIYDVTGAYGISFSMIAELYGKGASTEQVKAFFAALGFDASGDAPISNIIHSPNLTQTLSEKSITLSTVSAIALNTNKYVPAVLSEEAWSNGSLTYNFPSTVPSTHTGSFNTSRDWRALTALEQSYFNDIVSSQNQFVSLDAVKSLSESNSDIQVAAISHTSAEAFAYFPGAGIGGDIFLNQAGGNKYYYSEGGYGVYTMAHELGHAMGLEHTFDGVVLNSEVDNTYYSAMSYTLVGGYEVEAESTGSRYSTYTVDAYRMGLGIIDVAALQAMYGADMSTNNSDNVYVYNEDNRSFVGVSGHYFTIWDAGGVDTLDVSNARYASVVNLNDYTLSSISKRTPYEEAVEVAAKAKLGSSDQVSFIQDFIVSLEESAFLNHNNLGIAFGVVIENVVAGIGNDIITDNEVDNSIFAGAGDDAIYLGAGGYDRVDGGVGNDTVFIPEVFNDVKRFVDSDGYHIVATNFAATLVGVELIQYSDTFESIA